MESSKVHLQEKEDDALTNQKQFVWNPYISFMKEQQMINTHLVDSVNRLEAICGKLLMAVNSQKQTHRNRYYDLQDRVYDMHEKLREASIRQDSISEELGKQGEAVFRLRRNLQNHRMSMHEFTINQYDDLHDVLDMLDQITLHNTKMGEIQEEIIRKLTTEDLQRHPDNEESKRTVENPLED